MRSVALADVLSGLPGGACDFLKMDCEGAEYDMLLHLDEVSLKRIRRICLEYHEFVTPYSHTDLEKHSCRGVGVFASARAGCDGNLVFCTQSRPPAR